MTVFCSVCRKSMPVERLTIAGLNKCISCSDQNPVLGSVEGVSKQGQVNLVKANSEDARRAFNLGNAVIRRGSPKSIRIKKGGKF